MKVCQPGSFRYRSRYIRTNRDPTCTFPACQRLVNNPGQASDLQFCVERATGIEPALSAWELRESTVRELPLPPLSWADAVGTCLLATNISRRRLVLRTGYGPKCTFP